MATLCFWRDFNVPTPIGFGACGAWSVRLIKRIACARQRHVRSLKKNSGYDGAVFVDKTMMADIATSIPRQDNERIIEADQNVEASN